MEIWARGKEFEAYASYLWDIVYKYFDNLKEWGAYDPLKMLEERVTLIKAKKGVNWFARRMAELRRSYIVYLGKPHKMSQAIKKYNEMRGYDDKRIRNSSELFLSMKNAFDTDLRQWIEDEGAYKVIGYRLSDSGKQEYEKLIQKTIKTQIKYILLEKGFKVEILREPELLSDKKIDFIVYFGFVGPILIEIKLSSNRDIQGSKIEKSASYNSMKRYMKGYGAAYGFFLVFDNIKTKKRKEIIETFKKIEGVDVMIFDCQTVSSAEDKKKAKKKVKLKPKKK